MAQMDNEAINTPLKRNILVAVFNRMQLAMEQDLSLTNARDHFKHIDADTYAEAVADLCRAKLLLDLGRGYLVLTPKGTQTAKTLVDDNAAPLPSAASTQEKPSRLLPRKKSSAKAREPEPLPADPLMEQVSWLLEMMAPNLGQLHLAPTDQLKAQEYFEHLKTQLQGNPSPVLITEICRRLKKIVAEPVSAQLAAGSQPVIWGAVHALLNEI